MHIVIAAIAAAWYMPLYHIFIINKAVFIGKRFRTKYYTYNTFYEVYMRSKIITCILSFLILSFSIFGSACTGNASAQPTVPVSPVETTPPPTPSPSPTPAPTPDSSAAYIYEQNPELTPVDYSSSAILPPSSDAGQEYIDGITFLGDSTSYGFIFYGSLSGGKDTKQVWTGFRGTMTLSYQSTVGIKDPTDGSEKTIRQCVEQYKPEYMIITLGLNGVSFMDEEYFKTEYKSLVSDIQSLSPDTKLILQSIYPISPLYVHWGSITNEMITAANSWILQIAEENGCPYLDTYSALADAEGNLKPELDSGDGIHLNPNGLNAVLQYIRTHAYIPPESEANS